MVCRGSGFRGRLFNILILAYSFTLSHRFSISRRLRMFIDGFIGPA